MNTIKRNLMATLLLAALGAPIAVLAEEAPVSAAAEPVASATRAERMERMQTMRARMGEIRQTTDPVKRRALLEAQLNDMEAMARMGPPDGMGMMMGRHDMSDCRMGRDKGWRHHDRDDVVERRLDSLEKRVDMMQMMLGKMLGH